MSLILTNSLNLLVSNAKKPLKFLLVCNQLSFYIFHHQNGLINDEREVFRIVNMS